LLFELLFLIFKLSLLTFELLSLTLGLLFQISDLVLSRPGRIYRFFEVAFKPCGFFLCAGKISLQTVDPIIGNLSGLSMSRGSDSGMILQAFGLCLGGLAALLKLALNGTSLRRITAVLAIAVHGEKTNRSARQSRQSQETNSPSPAILVQAPAENVQIVVLCVAAEVAFFPESVVVVGAQENGEEVTKKVEETRDRRQEGIGVVERHGSSLVCCVASCGESGRLVHKCAGA
jgi:hypothetical protein